MMDRRAFLRFGVAAGATLLAGTGSAKPNAPLERSLGFYNTHTEETLRTVYWAEGKYQPDGLHEINRILRDHRTGEVHAMDQRLLDLLYALQARTGRRDKFHVISGYRSPATNAMLNARSTGVARHSYHMQGMAIDIRLPGYDLKKLHQAALALKAGGVGCYPASNFIHVDVGPVRRW
jgi:uncharacterized protein YcbK (DUF882 family)